MKICLTQPVKIKGDNFPHRWSKEYDSLVIPRIGDSIEDPLWKDPGEYKVTGISISYYEDACYVGLEQYGYEIPAEQKDEQAKMAKLHGWKSSWKR